VSTTSDRTRGTCRARGDLRDLERVRQAGPHEVVAGGPETASWRRAGAAPRSARCARGRARTRSASATWAPRAPTAPGPPGSSRARPAPMHGCSTRRLAGGTHGRTALGRHERHLSQRPGSRARSPARAPRAPLVTSSARTKRPGPGIGRPGRREEHDPRDEVDPDQQGTRTVNDARSAFRPVLPATRWCRARARRRCRRPRSAPRPQVATGRVQVGQDDDDQDEGPTSTANATAIPRIRTAAPEPSLSPPTEEPAAAEVTATLSNVETSTARPSREPGQLTQLAGHGVPRHRAGRTSPAPRCGGRHAGRGAQHQHQHHDREHARDVEPRADDEVVGLEQTLPVAGVDQSRQDVETVASTSRRSVSLPPGRP